MGDPKQTAWQEWSQGISKIFIYVVYVTIGVVVTVTIEAQQVVMSKRRIIIRVILSICAGALASITCSKMGWEKYGAVIVPSVTIIGQELFRWLIGNWDKILNKLTGYKVAKKENDQIG